MVALLSYAGELHVGVDTHSACRSGAFIQEDSSVIHNSACHAGVEILPISKAVEKYDWRKDVRFQTYATFNRGIEEMNSTMGYLDVLPKGVNKGSAAAFLASHWSLPRERVLVSGDTGNDLAMFAQGFRGIVVANAHAVLKRLDAPTVYHARRGHAAGVLEGLRHWLELPLGA